MRCSQIWFVTLLGFALFATAAMANPYQAANIQIIVENQEDPRNAAILEAQKQALQIVLQQVSGLGAETKFPKVSDAQISDYVLALTVEQEKFLGARYLGRFRIDFVPSAIDALLAKHAGARGAGRTTITAHAALLSLSDWIALRQKLEQVAGLEPIQIISLSQESVSVTLSSGLPLPDLLAALKTAGIEAQPDSTLGGYTLNAATEDAAAAQAPQTPAPPPAITPPLDALADPGVPLPPVHSLKQP